MGNAKRTARDQGVARLLKNRATGSTRRVPTQICYACDDQAIAPDHVPPRVFYPEKKDIGVDLRSDPITVPSCKRHNQDASVSDELAAYAIVVSISNNQIAMNQFSTKVLRAFGRSKYVRAMYLDTMKWLTVRKRKVPSFSIQRPDESISVYEFGCHFDRTMEKIARGLYYYVFNRRLDHQAPLNIHSPQLLSQSHPSFVMSVNAELSRNIKRYVWTSVATPHKEIFQFSYWLHPEFQNQFAFWFTFYEGFQVWVFTNNILK